MAQQGEELTYRQMVEQQCEARRTIHELYERARDAERECGLLLGALNQVLSMLETQHSAAMSAQEKDIVSILRGAVDAIMGRGKTDGVMESIHRGGANEPTRRRRLFSKLNRIVHCNAVVSHAFRLHDNAVDALSEAVIGLAEREERLMTELMRKVENAPLPVFVVKEENTEE